MADKKVISGKLQLVVSYEDGGKQKIAAFLFPALRPMRSRPAYGRRQTRWRAFRKIIWTR